MYCKVNFLYDVRVSNTSNPCCSRNRVRFFLLNHSTCSGGTIECHFVENNLAHRLPASGVLTKSIPPAGKRRLSSIKHFDRSGKCSITSHIVTISNDCKSVLSARKPKVPWRTLRPIFCASPQIVWLISMPSASYPLSEAWFTKKPVAAPISSRRLAFGLVLCKRARYC